VEEKEESYLIKDPERQPSLNVKELLLALLGLVSVVKR